MANDDHVAQLKKGVAAWNMWRSDNPSIRPDLSKANLKGMKLNEVNLSGANLKEVNLAKARLRAANLSSSDIRNANLRAADFSEGNLSDARLRLASLRSASFRQLAPAASKRDVKFYARQAWEHQ